MANPLSDFAASAYDALQSIAAGVADFLLGDRTFGGDPAFDDPESQIPPFTPPFTGGQCAGRQYQLQVSVIQSQNGSDISTTSIVFGNSPVIFGAIRDIRAISVDDGFTVNGYLIADNDNGGNPQVREIATGFSTATNVQVRLSGLQLRLASLAPDNCGNLPNPNVPVPPSVGGGNLVVINDEPMEIYGGIAIPSFAALLAALKTIADGIAAIGDVLDGVRRIGDAINKIREILDDFLGRENDKDKENPKKRKISVGGWREMPVDGGFGTGKFTAQDIEYSPFQLQIEVEAFPPTCSRRLGVKSPTYAHLEPIGWIFLRSSNGGYSEPVPIRYLRNSISLNEDTNGISFSFRENPLAKAKCRVWYSSEPSITGNI